MPTQSNLSNLNKVNPPSIIVFLQKEKKRVKMKQFGSISIVWEKATRGESGEENLNH